MKNVKIIIFLCIILCIAAIPSNSGSNPWIVIKQERATYWIRHDSIVSVIDNTDEEFARHQGKATIGLMNGQELHFNKSANELMDMINR
jgi:hypothetical protein